MGLLQSPLLLLQSDLQYHCSMCLNYFQVPLLPVDAAPAEAVTDADNGVADEMSAEVSVDRVGLVVADIAEAGGSDTVVGEVDIDGELVELGKIATAEQADLDHTGNSFAIHRLGQNSYSRPIP